MRLRNEIGPLFTSITFVLFVFSGMLKWIPFWPIDPTLVFGGFCVLIMIKTILTKHLIISRHLHFPILLIIIFFVWYLVSATYSVSDNFWQHKALILLLSILAFFFPIICFRSQEYFTHFKLPVLSMSYIAAAIVFFFYLTDNLNFLLLQGGDKDLYKMPDYLGLGALISMGILLSLDKFNYFKIIFCMLLLVPALLVIGARGPTVFVFLCILAGSVFVWIFQPAGISSNSSRKLIENKKIETQNQKGNKSHLFSILTIIITFMVLLFYWEGSELLVKRSTKVFQDHTALEDAFRYDEFMIAWDVITDNPIIGVGIGGYGFAGYGMDQDIYPHNILLEAMAETGLFGMAFFVAALIMLFMIPLKYLRDRTLAIYYLLMVFLFFNYMKSGGFISARDLFAFVGLVIARTNLHLINKSSKNL